MFLSRDGWELTKRQNVKYYLAGAVSLITFAVYLYTLRNNFVEWDDDVYVFNNPFIRAFDVGFFKRAFCGFYDSNWFPLTWISHAMDYAIWGLDPVGHHLTNNVLHSANTFIVVLLALRLIETVYSKQYAVNSMQPSGSQVVEQASNGSTTQRLNFSPSRFTTHDSRFTFIAAATTGLLFGLHPVHVESVAWVAERKDLLCALFFLLSIMAYLNAQSAKGIGQRAMDRNRRVFDALLYALCSMRFALFFFVLALLSKPMAVSLPFVLLILDWYPLERIRSIKSFRVAFLEKLPFFALSAASSAVTVLAQRSGGSMASMEALPFSSRLPVAFQSLTAYLGKMILPLHLMPFYPYPRNISLLAPEFFLPIVLAAGITLACVMVSGKQRLWLSAWSYYSIVLIPVLGIVQVGNQAMADRYTYLPSLGPFLVAGLMAAWLYEKVKGAGPLGLYLRAGWVAAATAGLILVSYASMRQIGIWSSGLVLWNHVIKEEPSKVPQAYNNRGFILLQKGLTDEAIVDFREAVSLDPAYSAAYNNLCLALKSKGLYGEAIEQCRTAIWLNPDYAEAHNNLGVLYKAERLDDKAMEQYRIALSLRPDYAEALFNLGILYLDRGDLEAARGAFEAGLKIRPDDLRARQVLSRIISR